MTFSTDMIRQCKNIVKVVIKINMISEAHVMNNTFHRVYFDLK